MWNKAGLLVVACGLSVSGCGGDKGAAAATPAPVPAQPAVEPPKPVEPAAVPPSAAPSSIDEASFSLRLAEAGPYKSGELSRVVLHLEPRGAYHINMEYPVEIGLSGDPATSFPKATLAKADAAKFDEKSARFDMPFTAAAAGDHKLMANVKFAVCTPENCVPDERNLSLAVAVK